MQDTKEYVVAPKLAHHLIGILFTGAIAGTCAYMAMTNTSGIATRRTNLSPEMLNIILWVLSVAAGLLGLIFLAELVLTQIRAVPKIRLTPTEISIPMIAAFRKQTVTASYAQITQVMVELSAPNRLLRIHTTAGNATVAELNVGAGVFEEIYATLLQRAPRLENRSAIN
ncbi:hypothetical protein F2P44_22695 [Massilia sp. CCM 8695]|uniref:DUF304 domain-containing protein n=1 Tax=Massilia frigida TaxID=2609281 RepID=A0ABX0NGA5_9BURK|nr:hypothetical protein [Massilia frigida]NHZ82064.1 hypothetical protein [Massilia frigida]